MTPFILECLEAKDTERLVKERNAIEGILENEKKHFRKESPDLVRLRDFVNDSIMSLIGYVPSAFVNFSETK